MLDVTTTLEDVLYSPIEPYDSGMLSVSEIHTIAWEKSGNPDGIPVIVIHGGPGGGGQPAYRQYFDPKTYNIIQFDQRGCGKSTPYAELIENNTQASVSDIEQLRQLFEIEKWHVFGGSWGSTLALVYAQEHPQRALSLMLRGIFMCRKSELQWFYQDGASHIFPDAFESYREHIPKQEQGDLIKAYHLRLTSDDVNTSVVLLQRNGRDGKWPQAGFSQTIRILKKQKILILQLRLRVSNVTISSMLFSLKRLISSTMLTQFSTYQRQLFKAVTMLSAQHVVLGNYTNQCRTASLSSCLMLGILWAK